MLFSALIFSIQIHNKFYRTFLSILYTWYVDKELKLQKKKKFRERNTCLRFGLLGVKLSLWKLFLIFLLNRTHFPFLFSKVRIEKNENNKKQQKHFLWFPVFILCIQCFFLKQVFKSENKIKIRSFTIKNEKKINENQKIFYQTKATPKAFCIFLPEKKSIAWDGSYSIILGGSNMARMLEITFSDSLFQLLKVPCIVGWILPWR